MRRDHRDENCRRIDVPCFWPGGSFGVKTTRREDRRIVPQALVDSTVTRSTIRADVGVAIVPQTISRHLAEANLKSKRPFHALPLTPEHRQLRLQWCQARSMWNVTYWQKVVFSDESRFVLGTDDNRVRVWRRPGPFLNGLPGAIFQQDSARPHTARVAQDFLHHFQTLPWPAWWHVLQLEVVKRDIEVAQYLCRCSPCIRFIALFLRSSVSLICVIMCIKFHFNPMLSSCVAIFNVPPVTPLRKRFSQNPSYSGSLLSEWNLLTEFRDFTSNSLKKELIAYNAS
ncbi:transposable element Tc1 transposase [Trichonephila clavipes]|nr:transposable element Tc1 transposase [Trichonephila clavipes]